MKTNKMLAVTLVTALSVSGLVYGQGFNPSGELPADFMEMTQEERQAFRQSQGIEPRMNRRPEGMNGMNKMPQNIELPTDWEEMTQEEKRAYMEENRPEKLKNMTDEEREAFQATRQLKNKEANQRNQSQNRFTRNAKKAQNYQKFEGELKQKKNFTDGARIKNRDAVDFLQQRGILDGYGDGSFKPENPINRAESIKVLLESIGETPDTNSQEIFSDVPADAWFAGYVNKAKRQGIVKGYEDGTFKPEKTVNQVELLKVAFESFGIDLSDYPVTDLPTESDMNAWYAPYLQYAVDNSLLDLETVDPGEGMTREAFSEVIYRLIQQQESI